MDGSYSYSDNALSPVPCPQPQLLVEGNNLPPIVINAVHQMDHHIEDEATTTGYKGGLDFAARKRLSDLLLRAS